MPVDSIQMTIRSLQNELSKAHSEMITLRNQWFEVFGDIEKENSRELHTLGRLAEKMEQRALKAERQLGAAQDKITQQRHPKGDKERVVPMHHSLTADL